MVKHKITIYKDTEYGRNTEEQFVFESADYGLRYALFCALIDRGFDFKIEIDKDAEKQQ